MVSQSSVVFQISGWAPIEIYELISNSRAILGEEATGQYNTWVSTVENFVESQMNSSGLVTPITWESIDEYQNVSLEGHSCQSIYCDQRLKMYIMNWK